TSVPATPGSRTSGTNTARPGRSPRSTRSCAPTSRPPAEAGPHRRSPSTMAPNDPVHLRGPVLVRRDDGGDRTTTDQRLLDRNQDTDWLHTDPWRVLRIQSEFVNGFGALAELPDAVSVFGSARTR